MAVSDALNALKLGVSDAYTSVEEKGGTIPANKNVDNLAGAIDSITGGGGIEVPITETVQYESGTTTKTFGRDGELQVFSISSNFSSLSSEWNNFNVQLGSSVFPISFLGTTYKPTHVDLDRGANHILWYFEGAYETVSAQASVDIADINNWEDISESCNTILRAGYQSSTDIPGKLYMFRPEMPVRVDTGLNIEEYPVEVKIGTADISTSALWTGYNESLVQLEDTSSLIPSTVSNASGRFFARTSKDSYKSSNVNPVIYIDTTAGRLCDLSKYRGDWSVATAAQYRYGFFINGLGNTGNTRVGVGVNGLIKSGVTGLDLTRHMLAWVNNTCESLGGLSYILNAFKTKALAEPKFQSTQYTGSVFTNAIPTNPYYYDSSEQAVAALQGLSTPIQVHKNDSVTLAVIPPEGATASGTASGEFSSVAPEADFTNVKIVTIRYRDEATWETISEKVIIKGLPGSYIPDTIDLTNQYM